MILLCCSFASASFTSRNQSPLSVDRLNSKIHTICRASLNAPPSGRLPQKQFVEKDVGSRLYRLFSLFFHWYFHLYFLCLRVSSKASSLLLFGFGVACMLSYRCLQMKWWTAVIVFAIPSQPALLIWPYVSAAKLSMLLPKASRTFLHSRHPADCILPIVAT